MKINEAKVPYIEKEKIDKIVNDITDLTKRTILTGNMYPLKKIREIEVTDFYNKKIKISIYARILLEDDFADYFHRRKYYRISGTNIDDKVKIYVTLEDGKVSLRNIDQNFTKDLRSVIRHELGHGQRFIQSGYKYDYLNDILAKDPTKSLWNQYVNHAIEMEANIPILADYYHDLTEKEKKNIRLVDLILRSTTKEIALSLLSSENRLKYLRKRLAREGIVILK